MRAAPGIEALLAGVGGSEERWEGPAGVVDTRAADGRRAAELATEKVGMKEGTPPVENTMCMLQCNIASDLVLCGPGVCTQQHNALSCLPGAACTCESAYPLPRWSLRWSMWCSWLCRGNYNGRSGWLGVAPNRGVAYTRVSWSFDYRKVCVWVGRMRLCMFSKKVLPDEEDTVDIAAGRECDGGRWLPCSPLWGDRSTPAGLLKRGPWLWRQRLPLWVG